MSKIRTKSMFDVFEVDGYWYLPGREVKDWVAGTLFYSPEKIELRLFGYIDINNENQTIFGFSSSGEYFSLFSCLQQKLKSSYPGFKVQKINVSILCVGDRNLENLEDNIFYVGKFSTNFMNEFMDTKVLRKSCLSLTKRGDTLCAYNDIEEKKIKISLNGINIKESHQIVSKSDLGDVSYFVNRFYYMETINEKAADYKFYLNNIHTISKLLSLLMGEWLHIREFSLFAERIPDHPTAREHYRFFFKQVGEASLNRKRRENIQVTRSKIVDQYENIFNQWFNKSEKLGIVVDSHLSNMQLPTFLHTQFLNSIRNLEVYYRNFMEEVSNLPPEIEDDKKKLLDLIADFEGESKKYFESRINYVGEIPLRKKIEKIIEQLPNDIAESLIITEGKSLKKSKKKFVASLVDTRNYYTHRDKKEKYENLIVDIRELFYFVEKLKCITEILVFKELGLGEEIVLEELKKRYHVLEQKELTY